ncbi:HdeD family acid-resistance protein [Chelatococcus sp. SYSU_G07232]|uniref:HdeD family acid-resistance protein n=1 Tax=Chelatococcus albus TaxID=3047466 RepID=A0ABT7AI57_9HYPH|nr:HdeD family acid-resistance protein [Chelatococcus sp. SYSU_G07232]MDJ1159081.1 HdeD family acid-resistance protein [Chelatococcus sp. SYSU_G07232]
MTDVTQAPHSPGAAMTEVRSRWGWFVALGAGLLVFGGIAFANLFLATVASIYYIGAMMLVGGLIQTVHAFKVKTWSRFAYWLLSGLLYAIAGFIFFSYPVLASAVVTLVFAVTLIVAGVLRIWVGFQARPEQGWGWIVAAGVLTLLTGIVVAVGWPVNSLWILGLLLAIDLVFQGWAFIAFGLALKSRR